MSDERPIGVFDSGVGGLTVVRVLRALLPTENICYLGDTARLPYGTKSAATINRYALQVSRQLLTHDVKAMVVACHSASAHALKALRSANPELPVMGVISPAAQAVAQSGYNKILVLATEATASSNAYESNIKRYHPAAQVVVMGCPVLVALAEAGWTTGPVVAASVAKYLQYSHLSTPDAVILGCTHFPLLAATISAAMPASTVLIDPAISVGKQLQQLLLDHSLVNEKGGVLALFSTDEAQRFASIGSQFLGVCIKASDVGLVDLQDDHRRETAR